MNLDFHVCIGSMGVFRVGPEVGFGPDTGAVFGLSFGLNRRTGTPWQAE